MATPAPPSKLQNILSILQSVLTALGTVVPGTGLAAVLLGIFQNASSLYQQETGQPFDITKIPQETPVP